MSGMTSSQARLYLNGNDVGAVTVRGWEGAWGFGNFEPDPAFSPFAARYARWAQLLHADDGSGRLSRSASAELRALEYDLYRIKARVLFLDEQRWVEIALLNIDGSLIEWKQRWSDQGSNRPLITEKGITI